MDYALDEKDDEETMSDFADAISDSNHALVEAVVDVTSTEIENYESGSTPYEVVAMLHEVHYKSVVDQLST